MQMNGVMEWWEHPNADPQRPMLPAQAVAFLQMGPPRYPDPVKTILRWARDGDIKKIHIGNQVYFTLGILREYSIRDLSSTRRRVG